MQVVTQEGIDAADDMLLEGVRAFLEARGGLPEVIGGIEVVMISERRFSVLVHVEGFAPPLPGAQADG